MENNRLNIVSVENKKTPQGNKSLGFYSGRADAEAKFERLWLLDPEKFNPMRDSKNRDRINRTWKGILEDVPFPLTGKKAVDLGCGYGVLTFKMRDAGATVDAVDIAANALKRLQGKDLHNIKLIQDWVPKTKLEDESYDLVLCTELIAELHPYDFRLFFSELSRLIKPEGYAVCSTAIDINSQDALERFYHLTETEFHVSHWIFSYHRLYIRLCDFFAAPAKFYRAYKDENFKKEILENRRGFSRFWFSLNSTFPLAYLWKVLDFISCPVYRFLKQSDSTMLFLEKVCRFFWDTGGISHAIFIGKRRPLIPEPATPILGKIRTRKWE